MVPGMKSWTIFWIAFAAHNLCHAQIAPGEDPVLVAKQIQRNMVPSSQGVSSPQPAFVEIPAWMDAKLARFQAKAFAADTSGIWTDENVITSYSKDGLRKVCTQDIGSNSTINASQSFNRYGPRADSQIVVLRGDLVNICR